MQQAAASAAQSAIESAKEAARDDARRLDLGTLDFNDDGTLTSAALDAFVAAMPPSEQSWQDAARPAAIAFVRAFMRRLP